MFSLHHIKQGVARAIGRWVDLDRRIQARRGRYVICYHRVITEAQAADEWVHHSMWISPQTFDAQIRGMLAVGDIVPLERILDFDTPNERPLFALTFDDGWHDNYEQALPVMTRNGVTATVFLATSYMDDGRLIWPEDLALKTKQAAARHSQAQIASMIRALAPEPARLDPAAGPRESIEAAIEQLKLVTDSQRAERIATYCQALGCDSQPLRGYMMNWSEVARMHAAGIRIGSHTHTHRICSQSTPEQIEEELRLSRDRIRAMVGCEVETFAYPNARYHGWEGPVLQRAGYRSAFRIHNLPLTRTADPFFLPRLISAESVSGPEFFKLRLLGAF